MLADAEAAVELRHAADEANVERLVPRFDGHYRLREARRQAGCLPARVEIAPVAPAQVM